MRPNDIYTVDDLVDNLRECAKDWLYCGGSEALEEQFELASEAIRERVTDFEAKVIALQKELDELKNGDKQYKRKVGKPDVGEDLILFMQYDDIDTEYALGYMEEDGKFYFSQDEEGKFEDEYWAVIAWAYVAALNSHS